MIWPAIVVLTLCLVAPQAWAWYQLRAARSALAAHHPEQARDSLASCQKVWGDRATVHLLAARAAWQAGDLPGSFIELREAQRLTGATPETAFEWALIQAARGNISEVEEYLHGRAQQSPDDAPLVWEALAEGYLRLYRTPDAMACLNVWLKRHPDNIRALELRGRTYVTGRGVVRGSEDFRKVLALDPSRKQTRWRLIGCLLELGDYDGAAEHLELLNRETPGDPEIAARLARCYIMSQRTNEAGQLLDAALASHPDHGLCLRIRGQLALSLKQPSEAEAVLRRAVVVLPEDYQCQWLLFEAIRQQGKIEEAVAQQRKAEEVKERVERLGELTSRRLAEQPLDPALHYEMAMLLFRTGQPDPAEQWLLSALKLDPNHKPSHAALADHYERRGNMLLAEEHRKKAAP